MRRADSLAAIPSSDFASAPRGELVLTPELVAPWLKGNKSQDAKKWRAALALFPEMGKPITREGFRAFREGLAPVVPAALDALDRPGVRKLLHTLTPRELRLVNRARVQHGRRPVFAQRPPRIASTRVRRPRARQPRRRRTDCITSRPTRAGPGGDDPPGEPPGLAHQVAGGVR
jgi:hypothetical protein